MGDLGALADIIFTWARRMSFLASTMSFLALYGSPCIPPVLCGIFWATVFFLLSVWSPCYTLLYTKQKKKTKKKFDNVIRGGFGSTWGHNSYMGTQNGSK